MTRPFEISEDTKRLLVVVKNPLTARDRDRMGMDVLREAFDLTVLDCSAWLMPQTADTRDRPAIDDLRVVPIGSLAEFKTVLAGLGVGIVIDYVGQFSVSSLLMFKELKSRGWKTVVVDSGSFPTPEEWRQLPVTGNALTYALRSRFVSRALRALGRRALLRALPDLSADLALVAGDSWRTDARFTKAKRHAPAHSFDYETFRRVDAKPVGDGAEYAVYIDEMLPFHEDNRELGYRAPVSMPRFGKALRRFFERFEAAASMPVRVAGYPSAQKADYDEMVGDRIVEFGKTAELVRGAQVVFAHASTAISFAVLWRRPIVFLTTPELNNSWYFPWVKAPRDVLHSILFDMEQESLPALDDLFALDMEAYGRYENIYLRASNAPRAGLWEIFSQAVRALGATSVAC